MQNLDPEDRVFTDSLGPYTKVRVSEKFKHLCKRASIPHGDKTLNKKGERVGIVFHCLRHTRITKWVKAGYSDEIIRRASGHMSLKAYQQYIKLDPSDVMRLVSEPKTDKNGIKSALTLTR